MKKLFVGAFSAAVVVSCAAPITAFAQQKQLPNGVPIVEVRQVNNSYNYAPATPANSQIGRTVPIGQALVTGQSVSDVSPKATTTTRLPIGKGAAVTATLPIARRSIGKALILSAKIGAGVALSPVGAIALSALIDYGINNATVGEDGTLVAQSPDSNSILSDGYEYRYAELSAGYSTPQAACNAFSQYKGGTFFSIDAQFCTWKKSDGNLAATGLPTKQTSFTCPAGKYWVSYTSCSDKPSMLTMSEQEILDKIASSNAWPSSSAVALAGMLSDPDIRPTLFEDFPGIILDGPASVPGETTSGSEAVSLIPGTTTIAPPGTANTEPGTKTSTSTKSHPLTYSGSSVGYSTVNNTVTNITNNVSNVSSTTVKTEEVKDDDKTQQPVDTGLGKVPKLYEKKYPDGVSGVWNAKKAEFAQTSFFALIQELTPKVGQAGSCPSWSIDLSWTPGGSMGVHELQPPCMIWPILKLIVIISALFLARALIFGG